MLAAAEPISSARIDLGHPVEPREICDAALLKDLTSVIALLGLPCSQVVSATPMRDSGHRVTCQDGNRYRVFINAEGRVVAQKQP